ncbi:T9SS type A sorting domain-containing protein [Frigoriflavimonas asaccharolytica]|uniref:Secretion system C-terminal sorting domain-containing protein n=1 Tax=Frigoriflavimonas asaccharolytica TaxID=2735899 RepID=A0A8J8G4G7_9FLAO|nr:T9SS type A sorting domain-containing protein [Frigoriflavimonas asaccharolytica]NRS91288.1 hypothetical protein [Frigoriflavimonas asaccharolytica]
MKKFLLIFFTILIVQISTAQVYVASDVVGGANNGTSWANAYTSLQNALLVNSFNGAKEFWVKAGTYTPGTSQSDMFTIYPNQTVYGGFNGTETMLNQRNFRTNSTILSGDLLGNDNQYSLIFNDPLRHDNAYTVVRMLGDTPVLDGLTIARGNAEGSIASVQKGAAIYIVNAANAKIENCIIEMNACYGGGAIFSEDQIGSPNMTTYIKGNIFRKNLASYAPAIYYVAKNGTQFNIELEDNLFYYNEVKPRAGNTGSNAIIWFRNPVGTASLEAKIVNSTFVENFMSGTTPSSVQPVVAASKEGSGAMTLKVYNSLFYYNYLNGAPATAIGTFGNIAAGTYQARNSGDESGFANITDKINCINSAPQFVNSSNNDYRLTATSDYVDIGNNSYANGNNQDLDGNPRIFGTVVDAGAFEFGSSTLATAEDISKLKFTIYPNPVSDFLNIKADFQIDTVEIYNLVGQKILIGKSSGLNVSKLKVGVYVLKITKNNGEVAMKKFIKR